MAYTAAELSGPLQLGDDKKLFFYDGSDSSDSLATVMASGYFNNNDDEIRMAVDDLIIAKGSDGTAMLMVTASTGGAVTTHLVSGNDVPIETGTTSAGLSGYGVSVLSATTGAQRIYALTAPTRAGQKKTLLATTTTVHTVTSTGDFVFGTTGATSVSIIGLASADARGCDLVAVSTTQYLLSAITETSTQGQVTTS